MDQFDLEQLNEVFDGPEDNNYDVVDLMPKAKTPQMFLLKGEGIHNLVVRLMAQKEGGDTLRNLMPNDKNVVVFVMTLNDKGNLGELKGGLGGNPVRALVTIFDTVYKAINPTVTQTIMFRFPAKKMGGQERSVRRVLERLIKVRGKNRFAVLSELANYSAKYSYVVAHKRNMEYTDLPGASVDTEKFKKVDTKVGDVYIDNDTGKETTLANAVAGEIAKKYDNITTVSVISKTKLSRKVLMGAMYSAEVFNTKRNSENQELFDNFSDSNSVHESTGTKSPIQKDINNIDMTALGKYLEDFQVKGWKTSDSVSQMHTFKLKDAIEAIANIKLAFKPGGKDSAAITNTLINGVGAIISKASPKNLQAAIVEISELVSRTDFGEMDKWERISITRTIIAAVLNGPVGNRIREAYTSDASKKETYYQYPKEQIEAIETYTGYRYENINNFLIGLDEKLHPEDLKTIQNLDEAFKNGSTLEKGTVLYRGQKMKIDQVRPMLDNKVLYFKNFVSTSLQPVIYSQFANSTPNIEPGAQDQTDFTSADLAQSTSFDDGDKEQIEDNDSRVSVDCGIVIKGADKINVIIPGAVSSYPMECEVILPRGTALKITKALGERADGSSEGTMLLETNVISADQLDESTDVYDGNTFLTEGRLEKINPFSFSSFYNNEVISEAIIPDDSSAAELLLAIIDLSDLSNKFK
jgi:hypothetical protein